MNTVNNREKGKLSCDTRVKFSRRQFLKFTGAAATWLFLNQLSSPDEVFVQASEMKSESSNIEARLSFCDNACTHQCGRLVYVKGNRIVAVRGLESDRFSNGKLCAKGIAAVGETYNPNRILYPLKREGDKWVKISWNQALDEIAAKLREIRKEWMERGGVSKQTYEEKERVAFYTTPRVRGEGLMLLYRFKRAFSARPHFGGCQACFGNFLRAAKSLFGYMFRSNYNTDLPKARYVVVWGSNWAVTMPVAWQFVMKAKENGAKIVCIDPVYSESASKSDWYIPIRPGTDGALALGILHVLFAENLTYPRLQEYVADGDLDKLKKLVEKYDPETVSKITWVPADTIRKLAREMANVGRKVAFILGSSLSTQMNGFQTCRAVMLIPAVLGAFGVPGGGIHAKAGVVGVMQLPTTGTKIEWWRFGMGKVDDIYDPGEQPINETAEGMIEGRVKVLFSNGSLANRIPNNLKFRKGLKKLKENGLIVHLTMFPDEMVDYAHYILPVAGELEEAGSNAMAGTSGALRWKEKVVEPLGESKPYWWIWNELGKRVYGDEVCTETTTGDGRDNPEYQKPLWPYEIFAKGPEAIFNYYMTITQKMMENMLVMKMKMKFMQMGMDETTAMKKAKLLAPNMNPFSGFTLENVKKWSPKGGISFPCPPMMTSRGGMPLVFMNPSDPEIPMFMTPDGKLHIDMGKRWNNAGLPEFKDTVEMPEDKSENINWSEEYPLILINRKLSSVHMHWASRWDPLAVEIEPEVYAEMNPQTARYLGISDRDLIKISTPRGSVVRRVRLTERVHPKIVVVPHHNGLKSPTQGFCHDTINILTSDKPNEHTDIPGWKTAKCRVELQGRR